MAGNHILLAGGIILSYILYIFTARIVRSHRRAAKAKKWECAKAPVKETRLPLGIDLIQAALKADKAGRFPHELSQRFHDVGIASGLGKPVSTYQWSVLGVTGHATCDPENIKFILAKGFDDFVLGPVRRGNFMPLLGNGIFTQDGKAWEHTVS